MVERAFGHLKGRWKILMTENNENLDRVHITVTVCVILHNICILSQDDTEIEGCDDDNDDQERNDKNNDDENSPEPCGELLRDIITDYIFDL